MDEKQILKEIAFYSRFIHEHKKWNPIPFNRNKILQPNLKQTHILNKYKYVKKVEPTVIQSVQNISGNKVHINPNFKLNTIFNSNIVFSSHKIHVNRNILSKMESRIRHIDSLMKINTEKNPEPSTSCETQKFMNDNRSEVILQQNRRVVRRKSICSKYKIVKSHNTTNGMKNKYKIDRRNSSLINRSLRKKTTWHGISDIARNNIFKNKTWTSNNSNQFKLTNTKMSNKFGLNKITNKHQNRKLTNINGVLYKNSKNKLQKININDIKSTIPKRRRLLSVKGQKYVMSANKKTLKLVGNSSFGQNKTNLRKVFIRGIAYIQKFENTFVRFDNSSPVNTRKMRHRFAKPQVNKLRKNNLPCPVYRRFGTCRRKDAARCQFLHNPDQIYLCKKFLQGDCLDNNCLLSHKVSLEKMPTCKYFLEGCCVRNDCPYLHVKISPKAEICRKFLAGFCSNGIKCNERHQYLCPDFEKNAKCPRRKCVYPHKKKCEKEKLFEKPTLINVETSEIVENGNDNFVENLRYYVDAADSRGLPAEEETVKQVSEKELDTHINTEFCRRPKLGVLPSFIPLL